MVYIDDMVSKDPTPVVAFQERFLRRQPQLDPVLDAAAEVFMRIYQYYDAYAANCIITSALEFLTFFSVEAKIQELPLVRKAYRFPWFLRERTGVAEGFAFLMFPKRLGVDIMEYIQAMPDMVIWIDLANDLLSYVYLPKISVCHSLHQCCSSIQILQRGARGRISQLHPYTRLCRREGPDTSTR